MVLQSDLIIDEGSCSKKCYSFLCRGNMSSIRKKGSMISEQRVEKETINRNESLFVDSEKEAIR